MTVINSTSVLLVESDDRLRRVISASLEQLGIRVMEAKDAEHAENLLDETHPEILVVERDFPHGRNGKIIHSYRNRSSPPSGPVIVTTTDRLSDSWRRQHEPQVVVYKPFDIRHLSRVIIGFLKESAAVSQQTPGKRED